MEIFLEALLDSFLDTIKILPFLFLTYLLLEWIEHKGSEKTEKLIQKSGKAGPLVGSFLGIFPQCGFTAVASELYASQLISIGTLVALFVATSDEMLIVLIGNRVPAVSVLILLTMKLLFAVIVGYATELIFHKKKVGGEENNFTDLCEREHCHCEKGILHSAIHHTLHITIFLFVITLVLSLLIGFIGEETISQIFVGQTFLGPVIGSLFGLIPNCASSIILTELYCEKVLSLGTMMAGLVSGTGIGYLVLFRANREHIKQNIMIMAILVVLGFVFGFGIDALGLFANIL